MTLVFCVITLGETNERNKMNIYQKLLEIQKTVKGLSKDKKSHNYDYVTGNKLLSFIRPLMDEHGLVLKTEVISIENTRQDYQVWDRYAKPTPDWKPKNEILSKVMMRFTWVDVETGEKDENLFGANGQNDWEKGLGSALTYAERYFLLKYFHIATDEDDIDNPERKGDTKESAPKAKVVPAPKEDVKTDPILLKSINILGKAKHGDEWDASRPEWVKWATKNAKTSSKNLTNEEANKIIQGLNKK